ncbi:hypothetical protein V3W47_18905 [Deinococcus sp. YIM 134068]|uniref:hypothetical protein n=1 Tax=Deinococcus lichenicola TaxID=3118910 RepID=UPI002F94FFEA
MGASWWFQEYDPERDRRNRERKEREREKERDRKRAAKERERERRAEARLRQKEREHAAKLREREQRAERRASVSTRIEGKLGRGKTRAQVVASRRTGKRATVIPRTSSAPRSPASSSPPRPVPLATARAAAAKLTKKGSGWSAGDLAAALSIPTAETGPVLARLQASGHVRRAGGGYVSV